MEASALPGSVGLARPRLGLGAPLLRLRSDEQLVTLFRDGHEEAFRVIHDRYRQRLHAYARQMLAGSVSDAEDAVQEVFVRAYNGLRSNDRELALRAWLYRIAHNRCIDEIRRPQPLTTATMEDLTPNPAPDPQARIEQRDALRRLIADVRRLPDQQRSALLMRELGGMPYADVAEALDVSVPAVKSLLVRARVGLAQAGEARDTSCARIREDLIVSHDRGVRTSGLARRHMRDCPECRRFRSEVRGVSKRFAALLPALGPIGVVAKLLGMGGAGGGGAAAGTSAVATSGAAAGGTGAVAGAGAVAIGAGHVVTLIAAAVVTAGGAIELQRISPPVVLHPHHRHIARAGSGRATSRATVARLNGAPAAAAPDQDSVAAVTVPASTTTRARYTSKATGASLSHGPAGQTQSAATRPRPLPISELIDPDNTPADSTAPATGPTTTTSTTPTSATTTGTAPTGTPTTTVPTTAGTPTTPTGTAVPPGSTVTGPGAGTLPTNGTTTTTGTTGGSSAGTGQPSGLTPLTQTSKTSGTKSSGGSVALGATGSSTRRSTVRVYRSSHR